MGFIRNEAVLRGTGNPNIDVAIKDGGGNIPLMYEDEATTPMTLYIFNSALASGSKWVAAGANISRPFLKTGQTAATNADSILPSDNILHPAKTNLGASEATQPFETQYNQKLFGNTKVTGVQVNSLYGLDETTSVNVSVNPITGSDALDITAYPTSAFQTLSAAMLWISKCTALNFTINLVGTNSGNRALVTNAVTVIGKYITINSGHVHFTTGGLSLYKCTLRFINITNTVDVRPAFDLVNSQMYLEYGSTTLNYITGEAFGLRYNGKLYFRTSYTINFTGSNQYVIFNYGSGYSDVDINGTGVFTFNTGGIYTGCTFIKYGVTHPIEVRLADSVGIVALNGASLGNATIKRGYTGYSLGGYNELNDRNKNLALYNPKAIYTPNQQSFTDSVDAAAGSIINGEHYVDVLGYQKVMTSNPNDVKSWSTAGRPVAPYDGMDGYNTDDKVREYWNETTWVQY